MKSIVDRLARSFRLAVPASIASLVATSALTVPTTAQGADEKSACLGAYERAQVQRRDHHLQRAREELRSCARAACPALVRNDCITWLEQVQSAYPTITIRAVKDGADVADVKVTEDNVVVATRLDGSSLEVEPGEHAFRFETDGAPPVTLNLVAREREKDRIVPVSFVTPHHDEGVHAQADTGARPTPLGVYVLGGVGIAGLASFAILGGLGKSQESSLRSSCSPNCASSQIDSVRTDYVAADVGLGVGAAALATAAVWYLLRPNEEEHAPTDGTGVAVSPQPGGGYVQWRGTF